MKSSNIGGQAVMEGIMMRHKDQYAVAVRKPDGEIEIKTEDYKSVFGNLKIMKYPIFRGVRSFIDSLVVGIKCLMYSASFYEEEEVDEQLTLEEKQAAQKKKEKSDQITMYFTMIISVIAAVGIFMVLPYVLASLLRKVGATEVMVTVVEAFVKLALFLGYMMLISKMNDIQRTFMYHGAEHKCINCIEHGMDLTVENVMKSSRQHKRCGTSFLFLVMLVSIFLHFIFVLAPDMWMRIAGRILMVPVVAGVSFEFLRLAGNSDSFLVRMFSKPGLALQKLTTKEPTEDMVEVAIKAVEAVFDWRAYLREEFNREEESKK